MQYRIAALPWFIEDGEIRLALMVPSNAAYGGTSLQLAKGHYDKTTDASYLDAALREAKEELGLDRSKIRSSGILVGAAVEGQTAQYELRTYLLEVTGRAAFGPFGHETSRVEFPTAGEAPDLIRDMQKPVLRAALAVIRAGAKQTPGAPTAKSGVVDALEPCLPHMAAAWDRRRLVPFIGAGLSAPACASWQELVEALDGQPLNAPDAERLIARAHAAARRVRRSSANLAERIRGALYVGEVVPPQTTALAELSWPLVVTTNYDDIFATAYTAAHPRSPLEVLGRSERDCLRLHHSRTNPSAPVLWALQGFLARPDGELTSTVPRTERLASEVVLGHAEYRRVTHKEAHFRRTFGHLYQDASLLFLGFGLRDPYVLDLFGEVVEMVGLPSQPHYAIVEAGQVDPAFLRDRFGIRVIEYPAGQHSACENAIRAITGYISGMRTRRPSWSVTRELVQAELPQGRTCSVEIVRGKLPAEPATGVRTVLSAGPQFDLGEPIAEFARTAYGWTGERVSVSSGAPFEKLDCKHDVWALAARAEDGTRTLRAITEAMGAFFEHMLTTTGRNPLEVHFQLLAAGSGRRFPASASLVRMLQALQRAFVKHADVDPWPVVRIYVVDPEALGAIESGSIDVLELLSSEQVRVAVEIDEGERQELHHDTWAPSTTVAQIAERHDLALASWELAVSPSAATSSTELAVCSDLTIDELGVIPGAMLRFSRVSQPEASIHATIADQPREEHDDGERR